MLRGGVRGSKALGGRWLSVLVGLVVAAGLAFAPQALAAEGVLDAGDSHSCAVKTNSTPVCWGDNLYGQRTVPAEVGTVSSISAGLAHSCAVKTDDTPVCWGAAGFGFGQVTVPAGLTVSSISAGGAHSCAVKTDNTPVCWGDNSYGQRRIPTGTGTVSSISAGQSHSCAVKTDNTPVCWGYDGNGQRTVPADIGTVSSISAGQSHSCAVKTDNTPVCWGSNSYGQLTVPADTGTVLSISVGSSHSCAVKTDNTPVCWGYDDFGLLTVPAGTVSAISAGNSHSCAVKTDGTPVCWGNSYNEQATVPAGTGTVGPAPPRNTKRPVIRAASWLVGSTVTAQVGEWANGTTSVTRRWARCTGASASSCSFITGTDAEDGNETYTLTDDDRGKRLRAVETAENAEGSTHAVSTAVLIGLPRVDAAPTISGSKQTGKTLTATSGGWSENPKGHDYQWLRCTDATVGSCSPIDGKTDWTYVLTDEDDAKRIRVRVIAINDVGSSSPSTSKATGLIDIPTNTVRPVLTGSGGVGSVLTTGLGEWTGTLTGHEVAWVRCTGIAFSTCTSIDGAAGTTYTLLPEDEDYRIRSRVRATSLSGTSAPAYSYGIVAFD